jgi:hypothetical protein
MIFGRQLAECHPSNCLKGYYNCISSLRDIVNLVAEKYCHFFQC